MEKYFCEFCGKEADNIVNEYSCPYVYYLCDECFKSHEENKEVLIPQSYKRDLMEGNW